jgi:cysteine-rich repeat protein
MSFDGSGDLVVIEPINDEVYSVPLPAGGAPTAVTSAGAWGAFGISPADVAVESDGSLLVCQRGVSGPDAEIWRVPGGTGTTVLLSSSPSTPNGSPQSLFVVQRACGDGVIQAELGETCDDGNLTSGDGCNFRCVLEACGDGKLDVGEECDDGNTAPADTCSAACEFEDLYFMNGSADGGAGVSVTLDGVVVAVAPVAGQTAVQVLAALALAINADGALDALGTKATTHGEALYTNGSFTARTNTDTGLAWGARSDLQLENSGLEIGLAPFSTMVTAAISQGVAPVFLVWEDGSFTLPSSVFVGTPATATGMATELTTHTVALDVANAAIACNPGNWTPTTVTLLASGGDMQAKIHGPPGVRCVGPLNGHLELLLGSSPFTSFPLSVIGGPASSARYAQGTIFTGATSVAIGGVPWTEGTASVVYYPPAEWTLGGPPPNLTSIVTTATGNDARRFDGIGVLNVVTPIAITTGRANPGTQTRADSPGFATLKLQFIPEPGAFAMLGAGSALLALMSWRRSSRRGRRR